MSGSLTLYQVRYRAVGATQWVNYGAPTSNVSATITGLDPNSSYEIEVLAENTNGVVASLIVPATTSGTTLVPPANLVVSNITSTSLTLTWQPPSSGSPPIVYQPQMRVSGVGTFQNVGNPISATTVSIFGLTAGAQYDFQVVASNPTNFATSSIVSATTTPGAGPTPATNLRASNITQSSLGLTWTASASGAQPIVYQVFFRTGVNAFVAYGSKTTQTSAAITGLTAGTSYDFYVAASNQYASSNSGVLTITTSAATSAPTAVQAINATNVTDTTLTLNWTAATGATSYQPQYRVHNTGSFASFGSPTTALTANITGLTASSYYDFQVIASNGGGSTVSTIQAISTYASATTPPSGVPVLSIVNANSSSITASCTAPTSGTAPFEYQFRYQLVGSIEWNISAGGAALTILPSGGTQLTLTGLTPNTAYNLDVIALNASGAITSASVNKSTTALVAGGGGPGTVSGSQNTGTSDPTIAGPASASVGMGSTLSAIGVTLADTIEPHAGQCALNVGCNTGTVHVTTSGTILAGAQNSNYVSISDTFANCQTSAASIVYTAPGALGSDTLTVQLYDQAGSNNTLSIPVSIINNAPSVPEPYATNVTGTTLTLNWGASQGSGVSYQPAFRTTGTSGWTNIGGAISALNVAVTGLTAGASYDFQVSATSTSGTLISNAVTVVTTIGTVPAAPATPGVVSVGSTTATISWPASASGSRPVAYQLLWRTHGATNWNQTVPITPLLSQSIAGLTANTQYDIAVQAINAAGSAQSASALLTTSASAIPSDTTGVQAKPTQDFINRIGINTHWGSGDYSTRFNTTSLTTALGTLNGIKLIRDSGGSTGNYATVCRTVGCQVLMHISEEAQSSFVSELSSMRAFTALSKQYVFGYEGADDPDAGQAAGLSEQPSDAVFYQPNVWNAAQADGVNCVQFALSNLASEGNYGNQGAYAGYGNAQTYPANGVAPGVAINGTSTFPNAIAQAQLLTPTKPVVISEFGYPYTLGGATQGIYLMYGLFDAYASGAAYTFLANMMDGTNDSFGIFNADYTPRPAATYLANIIAILNDNGSAPLTFGPGLLNYTLTGMPATPAGSLMGGRQVLFQKSTGHFFLTLYNESSSPSLTSRTNVTLNLATAPAQVNIYDPTIGVTAQSSRSSPGNATTIALPQYPIIVEIIEGASTPPPPPSSGVPTDPQTPTAKQAHRIADMMEIFGAVTYSDGQDGANNSSAAGNNAALSYINGSTGLGMTCREYIADTATQQAFCAALASGSKVMWSLSGNVCNDNSSEVLTVAAYGAANGNWVEIVEGINEPNNNGGFGCPAVDPGATTTGQQALYNGIKGSSGNEKNILVASASCMNTGSGFEQAYYGSDLAANVAASDLYNTHYYPNSGSPSNDIAYMTSAVKSIWGGKPGMIGEFHPLMYQSGSFSYLASNNYDSLGAYYTVITLLLSFLDYSLKALIWFNLFDYVDGNGNSIFPVGSGLFHNGVSNPRAPAQAMRNMYQLTTDVGATKRSFTPGFLDITVSGLPSGARYDIFQNSSPGLFFIMLWYEQTTFSAATKPVTIKFNGGSMLKIEDFSLTNPITSALPTATQTLTAPGNDTTQITVNLCTEVRLIRVTHP